MKKLIIISGASFAFMNLLFFIIMSSYSISPFIASEICLTISTVLIYFVSASNIDSAFKISILFLFSFLALTKFVIAFFFKLPIRDNYVFLAILIIIVIELLIVFALKYFSKHA